MKSNLIRLLPALALCLYVGLHQALAGPPPATAFTYQGRLIDGGSTANGSYDLSFSLYNAGSGGGSVAGPLTNSAVPVTNGLFTVTLNFGSGVFNGAAYWLDISVRTNGSLVFNELSPRQQVTPSPYAIFAENSGAANSVASNGVSAAALSTAGSPAIGQVLSYNGSSLVWTDPASGSSGWSLTGNSATGADFLGTTNNEPLYFVVNGGRAGAMYPFPNGSPSVEWGAVNGVSLTGNGGNVIAGGGYSGAPNVIYSDYSSIGGGYDNQIYPSSSESVIAGGSGHRIFLSGGATIGGGGYNTISNASGSTIPGGFNNLVSGDYSFAAGNSAQATNSGTFVWADNTGSSFASTSNNQFSVRAGGGVRFVTGGAGMTIDGVQVGTSNGHLLLPFPAIIYSGSNPLLIDEGSFFAGEAGNLTLTGVSDVGVGLDALHSVTSGSDNVAVGEQTLYSNLNGDHNTATGYGALYSNTNGGDNTATGYQALENNTSGNDNTANGSSALYLNTTGNYNTASGYYALFSNTTGNDNTAIGYNALYANTTGSGNTANGRETLYFNTAGSGNAANGFQSLYSNTSGISNVASGALALYANTSGFANVANGVGALYGNTSGSANVANGYQALYSNSDGNFNTANGYQALFSNNGAGNVANGFKALYSNSSGFADVANGFQSLYANTSGSFNTANGDSALYSNTDGEGNVANGFNSLYYNQGSDNTAIGSQALYSNTIGNFNVALGYLAGYNLTTGIQNIEIGNQGQTGDDRTIRIGDPNTQQTTFIAGIYPRTTSGGIAVYVNSDGQLGTHPSSARYKDNIRTMAGASDVLLSLRPVTFRYKPEVDPKGIPQFGLVAEEVDRVNPDLVVHDKQHGIYTVRYEAVNAMLLNEFQKEHRKVESQNAEIQDLKARLEKLEQLMNQKHGGER